MKTTISLLSLLVFISLITAAAMAAETKPSVEYGKKLFSDPSLGTNGKSCASCHEEAALKKFAAQDSWFGGEATRLEDAVNFCIKGSLRGKPQPRNSVVLKSIAMYIKSFKQ